GYESWEEKLKEIEFDNVDAFENQMFDAIRNSVDKVTREKRKQRRREEIIVEIRFLVSQLEESSKKLFDAN
ncbi:11505_t:CDS:1, partial [Cetraspora pellucida]